MRIVLALSICVATALFMGAGQAPTTKKEPSLLDKVGTGAKNLVTGIGDTLTGKKKPAPAPKKPINGYATTSIKTGAAAKPPEKQSWLTSMFSSKEPDKQKTPSEWIAGKRPDF
jgi:hypothetical protein